MQLPLQSPDFTTKYSNRLYSYWGRISKIPGPELLNPTLVLMIVLIAKLERAICLIVYFGFKSYCFNIADSTMTTINKIYLQVLVQVLQRENLICSFIWIFQLAMSAVCSIRHCSQEVKEDLASKHRLSNTKTDYKSNYTALKQMVIGISH